MIVLGAGLSGLLAGALDRRATLLEAQPTLPHNHHAVLRFREDKIGKALNIPFRRVRVMKSVFTNGALTSAVTPATANHYARKVTGAITSRSILDLSSADRYIAPPDLVAQLAGACEGRIEFSRRIESLSGLPRPLISTIPLPAMLSLTATPPGAAEFERAAIRVMKFRVSGADVFQTVYFPDPDTPLYRASITGAELILELTGRGAMTQYALEPALAAFGLGLSDVEPLRTERQELGKILPLPSDVRKRTLSRLTREHGVFSLGRFATWRNVLMDDVFDDYHRIRSMMELDAYDFQKRIVQ